MKKYWHSNVHTSVFETIPACSCITNLPQNTTFKDDIHLILEIPRGEGEHSDDHMSITKFLKHLCIGTQLNVLRTKPLTTYKIHVTLL